jgi:hypothetical protein
MCSIYYFVLYTYIRMNIYIQCVRSYKLCVCERERTERWSVLPIRPNDTYPSFHLLSFALHVVVMLFSWRSSFLKQSKCRQHARALWRRGPRPRAANRQNIRLARDLCSLCDILHCSELGFYDGAKPALSPLGQKLHNPTASYDVLPLLLNFVIVCLY